MAANESDKEFVRSLGTQTWFVNFDHTDSHEVTEDDPSTRIRVPFDDANAYSSNVKLFSDVPTALGIMPGSHVVLVDIDGVGVRLIPSSTEGHFHLVINKWVNWDDYLELLRLLARMGIVEQGYVNMTEKRGAAFLRMPGIKKDQQFSIEEAYGNTGGTEVF